MRLQGCTPRECFTALTRLSLSCCLTQLIGTIIKLIATSPRLPTLDSQHNFTIPLPPPPLTQVPLMNIKSCTEQFLEKSGLNHTTLRLCGFHQVRVWCWRVAVGVCICRWDGCGCRV